MCWVRCVGQDSVGAFGWMGLSWVVGAGACGAVPWLACLESGTRPAGHGAGTNGCAWRYVVDHAFGRCLRVLIG